MGAICEALVFGGIPARALSHGHAVQYPQMAIARGRRGAAGEGHTRPRRRRLGPRVILVGARDVLRKTRGGHRRGTAQPRGLRATSLWLGHGCLFWIQDALRKWPAAPALAHAATLPEPPLVLSLCEGHANATHLLRCENEFSKLFRQRLIAPGGGRRCCRAVTVSDGKGGPAKWQGVPSA